MPEDSIPLAQLDEVAYQFGQLKDSISFFNANQETLHLALKRQDSFIIANAHWSYAMYYGNIESYEKSFYHYNIALDYFSKLKKEYQTARALYAMAFIKGQYRDYTGSEVLLFKAIKKFEQLKDYEYLSDSYNSLGILQIDIKEYDQALSYYDQALEYAKEMKNNNSNKYVSILNNKGIVQLKKGNFIKAIEYFNKALSENNDIERYARIIDNRAFSRLQLKDTTHVKKDLFRSLVIRDSMNNKAGVVMSKIRLSEYYEYIKDTIKSVQYASEANALAKKIKNGRDYLTTLKQLADLQPHKAHKYLHLYSNFSDSLNNAERKNVNKFTRIEFQTDEILETNKSLTQQRIWIFSASAALLLILSLLYFLKIQRAKNEKLFLETEQQKANEQVYLLTLKQQAALEEEKTRERNRISQELHDGILGRLFGTRVGLGFLELKTEKQIQEQHEAFLEELQDIEKEIRDVSHKLNDNFASANVNFVTIVKELLVAKSAIGGFQFRLDINQDIPWKTLDELVKVNIYRIIQETLQNTIKHAKAKNVILDFSIVEEDLLVTIQDDGVGFNPQKSKKGIGLKNMKSRIEKLDGSLEITSAVNKGIQIVIKIPLTCPKNKNTTTP